MSLFRRGDVWWYEFWFAGRRIQESSKSPSKTIVRTAEQNVADEFFSGYKLRLSNSAVFADYAIGHLKRLLGNKMLVDFNEAAVIKTLQGTSRNRYSSTTATFAWKRSGRRSNRLSKNRRTQSHPVNEMGRRRSPCRSPYMG